MILSCFLTHSFPFLSKRTLCLSQVIRSGTKARPQASDDWDSRDIVS